MGHLAATLGAEDADGRPGASWGLGDFHHLLKHRRLQPNALTITATTIDAEARVLDTDLAQALGMVEPRFIRANVITPNRAELEAFGSLIAVNSNPGPNGG